MHWMVSTPTQHSRFLAALATHLVKLEMYAPTGNEGQYWIWRLMIDKDQQGKGYGRAAMQEAIRLLKTRPDCKEIWLDFTPGNVVAARLYLSLGFEQMGVDEKGEIVMRLRM